MLRQFLGVALTAALVACGSQPSQKTAATTPASTAPGMSRAHYLPEETTYPVGSIPNAVLHDAVRHKDLVMTIEYPTRGGPYPVIIFSHGFGGSNTSYTPLTEYWAGHGFIVIKPSHADAGKLGPILAQRREDRRAEMEKRRAEGRARNSRNAQAQDQTPPQPDSLAEAIWATQTTADWVNRARDISLIIESLGAIEGMYPELAGKMDKSNIGVGGHSYGAFTAMMLNGMTSFAATPPIHAADPRVKAGLAFSPQGAGSLGLTQESWKDVKVPFMFITGTLDYVTAGDVKPRHDAFAYSPAGDKYFVSFTGARHMTFAGGVGDIGDDEIPMRSSSGYPATDPWGNPQQQQMQPNRGTNNGGSLFQRERRIFNAAKVASTAFWDAYLKNDSFARDYIKAGGPLESYNTGQITVERK